MARVHSLMEEYPPLAATTEVDEFGMTPLRVLSLSQTPNLDMLLAVMDASKSGHMVHNREMIAKGTGSPNKKEQTPRGPARAVAP
eukprot:scaffold6093_cov58-Cylindrotheca_fusiformis.AAC.1